MTQDEIIRMAQEAGLEYDEPPFQTKFVGTSEQLKRFAAIVAAHEREKVLSNDESLTLAHDVGYRKGQIAEREACAKVCEEFGRTINVETWDMAGEDCAAAIRARGNNK